MTRPTQSSPKTESGSFFQLARNSQGRPFPRQNEAREEPRRTPRSSRLSAAGLSSPLLAKRKCETNPTCSWGFSQGRSNLVIRMQKAGVALFLAVLVLTAQTPAPKPPAKHSNFLISRAVPDPAAVARGQKVFVASCGFCHGSKANGGENGPDLVRSPIALRDEHGDSLGPVILKGRPEKGMPAFAMTDAQIKDIAAFLRSRQQAAIDRSTYAIQNVVTGDPHKGQEYFNGAGQCATCHSATGDLQGHRPQIRSRCLAEPLPLSRDGPADAAPGWSQNEASARYRYHRVR